MITKDQLNSSSVVRLTVDPMTIPAIRNGLNQTFDHPERGTLPSNLPRVDLRREFYVVSDLLNRKSYNRPDHIGISPLDLGVTFSVRLDEIEIV